MNIKVAALTVSEKSSNINVDIALALKQCCFTSYACWDMTILMLVFGRGLHASLSYPFKQTGNSPENKQNTHISELDSKYPISSFFSFYFYWFRSYLSITPGSANLEILIKKNDNKKHTKQNNTKHTKNFWLSFCLNKECPKLLCGLGICLRRRQTIPMWNSSGEKGILQGITVCLVSAVLSTL